MKSLRELDALVVPSLASVLRFVVGGRARRRFVTGAAVVFAVTLLLVVVMAARAPSPGAGQAVKAPVRVGVSEGDSIPDYVSAAHGRLAELPAAASSTYALVSLEAYLAPDRLGGLLAEVPVAMVYLRVPLPGVPTEVIGVPVRVLPGDVLAAMDAAAVRKDAEQAEAEALAVRLVGDSPREKELRDGYAARAAQASAEATAYRRYCSCAYAVVVRAAPPALVALAARQGVRAVDPMPTVNRLAQAVLLPPMPEQLDKATSPEIPDDSPSPVGSSSATGRPSASPSGTASARPSPTGTWPMPQWPSPTHSPGR